MWFLLLLLIDNVEKRLSCSDTDAINDNKIITFFLLDGLVVEQHAGHAQKRRKGT